MGNGFIAYGTGTQIFDDGIGAGGYQYVSGTNSPITSYAAGAVGPTDTTGSGSGGPLMEPADFLNVVEDPARASVMGGYVTDQEDPLCLESDPMQQDDRCFRADNKPWTNYDPYWDVYTKGGTPYDSNSALSRNVYDTCTPVGHPSEHRSPTYYQTCTPGALDPDGHVHTAQHGCATNLAPRKAVFRLRQQQRRRDDQIGVQPMMLRP